MSRRTPPVAVNELLSTIPLSLEDIASRVNRSVSTLYRIKKGSPTPDAQLLKSLTSLAPKARKKHRTRFRFIDLFSGIGGMRLAAEAIGGECVFSCERDKHARHTYLKNFPDTLQHHTEDEIASVFPNDITQVDPSAIPNHDLLLAGFPCQPFSIAGVSKKNSLGRPHGFRCQEQGNLFFEIAEIIDQRRPAVFLLENVRNLERHDKGNTFRVIHDTLSNQLGYHVSYRVVDAKPWVPQHRERILIVGFREPTQFSFDDLAIPAKTKWPSLDSILHKANEAADGRFTIREGGRTRPHAKYTLTDHLWRYLQDYKRKHEAAGHGFGYGLVSPSDTTRTLSARYYKDGSEILLRQRGAQNPRRLTPRECARLMGFPRDFVIDVSDTQAYKQFGNSVVVPVITAVLASMAPHLMAVVRTSQSRLPLDVTIND